MSTDRDTTRIVRSWLEEGATALPDRVLDSVLDQLHATRQRRSWWPARRAHEMNVSVRLALAAAAVVIVAFAGFRFLTPNQQVGGPTSPPSAAPSASPFPTVRAATPLGAGGTPVNVGTYRAAFEPPFTFTISTVVNLDCTGQCHGSIDANQPSWLDMEFGGVHGAELMVFALAKVADPSSTGLVDPPAKPADIAALIATSPKLTVLAPPKAVTVGGLDASQLDVRAHEGFSLGSRPDVVGDVGLATMHDTRLIFVVVDGHTVVFAEQIGPANTTGVFEAAMNGLGPLLNSISWG
jgi:hypothetical protein